MFETAKLLLFFQICKNLWYFIWLFGYFVVSLQTFSNELAEKTYWFVAPLGMYFADKHTCFCARQGDLVCATPSVRFACSRIRHLAPRDTDQGAQQELD